MKPQIYVNLLWGYEKYELKGTTERNNAQPFMGCPTCVSKRCMHVSRCARISTVILVMVVMMLVMMQMLVVVVGAAMMIAMLTVVIALVKLMIDT